ncbi:hypothetical protein PIB30_045126 [Stylosanthes scabra]|uniref:Uncharacterized protein n=1 Tax=Stylosanthes scabra TaxID=79078 RepID=A0ABU6SG71_9FABA|nr:hypothetical protein [Stylosanthes scabra]
MGQMYTSKIEKLKIQRLISFLIRSIYVKHRKTFRQWRSGWRVSQFDAAVLVIKYSVGSLVYAMIRLKLDISQAVEVVSRHMHDLYKGHSQVVEWILRKGTNQLEVYFTVNGSFVHNGGKVHGSDRSCKRDDLTSRIAWRLGSWSKAHIGVL